MFEAHALALAELKSKVEQTSESDAKSIPAAERLARLDEQKKRLSGILWSDEVEPSHWLVDQTVHQMENQIVKYIHPNKCSSRRHEAGAQKTEQTFVLDSSGNLKSSRKAYEPSCPVTDALRLKEALGRRSIAYDQSGAFSYLVLEKWTQTLLEAIQREPPPETDRFLWSKVSEETRAKLSPTANPNAGSGDSVFQRWMDQPEVIMRLMPLPAGVSSRGEASEGPSAKRQKGSGKWSSSPASGKSDGKSKSKESRFDIPPDCVSCTASGKPICFLFNKNVCRRTKVAPGKRCEKGFHICWKRGCGGAPRS